MTERNYSRLVDWIQHEDGYIQVAVWMHYLPDGRRYGVQLTVVRVPDHALTLSRRRVGASYLHVLSTRNPREVTRQYLETARRLVYGDRWAVMSSGDALEGAWDWAE